MLVFHVFIESTIDKVWKEALSTLKLKSEGIGNKLKVAGKQK